MQQKLKSVFRSSSRKKRQHMEASNEYGPDFPRLQQLDKEERPIDFRSSYQSLNPSRGDTQLNCHSQPLSSIYEASYQSDAVREQARFTTSKESNPPETAISSIENDYKAYLPILSSVVNSDDLQHEKHRANNQIPTEERERPYQGCVKNQDISRHRGSIDALKRKPLPNTPDTVVRESSGINKNGDRKNEVEREMYRIVSGVVDLRDTVDEDMDVQWAPSVTHEVVKPHEHEIIQHKILREIHNYEYIHHIQPVYDIEVLPPRHWIPNPKGEGLIEISADQLPSCTGDNRRWNIVYKGEEMLAETRPNWRTESEVIDHPTYITGEGLERKETTIRHPPTLQDMTGYEGLVQPVHFDHKTGRRWLGEITTIQKLKQGPEGARDSGISLKELAKNLPGISEVPELPRSPELQHKSAFEPDRRQLVEHGNDEATIVAI